MNACVRGGRFRLVHFGDFFMSLDSIRERVNKKIKDEVAFILMEDSVSDVTRWVSTGCRELDYKISNSSEGGIPIGKITEITGLEATGKSLMAMQIMANAQKDGGLVVYIDTEQGLNSDFARRVGLDITNHFMHITSITVEDVFVLINEISAELQSMEKEAKKKKQEPEYKFALFVWDSVAATNPKVDLIEENPDPTATVALKPRILSKNVPMLLKTAWKQNIGFVFINQLRMVIGAMPGQDKYISVGGKAIPYYSSLRIRLQSIGKLKDKTGTIYGIKTRATVKKTRFGPPHRKAEFPIYFSYGIDNEESALAVLTKSSHIKRINHGKNGNGYLLSGETEELSLAELKSKMRFDNDIKSKVTQYLSEALVIDLKDPRLIELEVVEEGQDEQGD